MSAKVYDRPERQGLSPVIIAIGVIVLLVLGFFVYRWRFAQPAAQPSTTSPPAQSRSSLPTRRDSRAAMMRHIPGSDFPIGTLIPNLMKENNT